MASGHGGARAGAGRKPVTLVELVVEERFNASSARHRQLLEEEDLPAHWPDLVYFQRAYRRALSPHNRGAIARSFADLVAHRAVWPR